MISLAKYASPQHKTTTMAQSANIPRPQVLPPANGKKLWRVKRSVSASSTTSLDSNSSLECLNNSLKISAAGKQFLVRRPPMKRPKFKPGMPKDFVFVDLSPVKTASDDENESVSSASSVMSATSSPTKESPLSLTNESFGSFGDEDAFGSTFANYNYNQNQQCGFDLLDDNALLGLGLLNVQYDSNPDFQMQQAQLDNSRFLQYQNQSSNFVTPPMSAAPTFQATPAPVAPTHTRLVSCLAVPVQSSKKRQASGFQFKSYQGPGVKKPQRKHKRCFSEPLRKPELMVCTQTQTPQQSVCSQHQPQFADAETLEYSQKMLQNFDISYTPLTELLELDVEALQDPIDLDLNCTNLIFKDNFDLLSFVLL